MNRTHHPSIGSLRGLEFVPHGTALHTHRIHGTGIFTYIRLKFMVNVGKSTSPMDPMGYIIDVFVNCFWQYHFGALALTCPHER